jgi:hypothetical protein
MKKLLLTLAICALGLFNKTYAQCSATVATGFSQCSYYGDQIYAFSLNSISSSGSSGCATNGYSLYASPIWTLSMGNTYGWTASTGLWYSNGFGMWIDWNNDGQYTSSECVAAKPYAFNHSGTFQVPYSAVVNTNLRMRIRCAEYYSFSTSTSPCNYLNGYGETEDYYVYISCPASLPTLTVASSNTYICIGQTATVAAAGAQSYTWTGGVTQSVSFSPTVTTSYTVTGGITACPSVTTSAVKTISVATAPLPVSAVASATTICNGTTATLTASGANSFTWLPGPTTGSLAVVGPTANVTYTVTGYNGGGCPGATLVSITVNPKPSLTITPSSSVVCAGTSATLTASGALTYTWQQGGSNNATVVFTPTTPTLYTAMGSNSLGCSSSTTQVLLTTAAPTINVVSNKVSVCPGVSATLTASGASTYTWDTGANGNILVVSPSVATTYTATGTNTAGCSSQKTVSVGIINPKLNIISTTTVVCPGTQVNLTAVGGSNYSWNIGATGNAIFDTPSASTVYIVTGITNTLGMNCPTTGSIAITVHPLPAVTATAARTEMCKGEKNVITAGGASTYQWNTGSTSNTISLTGVVSTTLTVTGTDANNCTNTASVVVTVNKCTGIEQQASLGSVQIFPNPTKGIFTVTLNSASPSTVKVYNAAGKLIRDLNVNSDAVVIDIEKEANGIYIVDILQNGETISTSKIVKQ